MVEQIAAVILVFIYRKLQKQNVASLITTKKFNIILFVMCVICV